MPSSVMCNAPQSGLCQQGSLGRWFLQELACVLDHEYDFQRAEEVIRREENLKLWADSTSSISDDEGVYIQS